MRKMISVSRVFLKSNIKRFIPAICTMGTFLLVFNILLGFILSTTGVLSDSLTDNNTMHFMEVLFEGETIPNVEDINKNIASIDNVENVIFDFCHPILLESEDYQTSEILNLIGVPQGALKYFGIEGDKAEYFYLPSSKEKSFADYNKGVFEEGEYYIDENGELLSRIVLHSVDIVSYYKDMDFDMLPPDLAIIDENRMLDIYRGMNETEEYRVQRVLLTVENISDMKTIEEEIYNIYPDSIAKYSLKYTNELPHFTTVLIAGSSIIVAILFIICIINSRNSINQILDSRNRDIALLSLFGSGDKKIVSMFLIEFFTYGLITFVASVLFTVGLFGIFKFALQIDLLTDLYWVYLLVDLLIAMVVFGLISFTQISGRLKKLNNAKMFKEFLK